MTDFYDGVVVGGVVVLILMWIHHYVVVFRYYKGIVVKLSEVSAAKQAQHQDQEDATSEKIPPAPAKNPIGFLWDGK